MNAAAQITPIVRPRAGLPRFAARLAAKQAANVVAFGTSMTLSGGYLAYAEEELRARSGDPVVGVTNRGLRGFSTMLGAFRFGSDVVPLQPDLVLFEFAHNDATPTALDMIAPALYGMLRQLRAAAPGAEAAFVYLAPPGAAAGGPSAAMRRYEAVADELGIPSIDLAQPAEALVASGVVSWTGAEHALTVDGFHHSPLAAEVVGRPFARALADVAVRPAEQTPAREIPGSIFERTAARPAAAFAAAGPWTVGAAVDDERRQVDAYAGPVAQAAEPGSELRIAFDGRWLLVWTLGRTDLLVSVDGAPAAPVPVAAESGWMLVALTPMLADGPHRVSVARGPGPAVFGDAFVVGAFT